MIKLVLFATGVVPKKLQEILKLGVFAYEYFIFFGRVTSPSAKPPFLEDQFVSILKLPNFRLAP